jgi:hypothetical protein
LSGFKLLGRGNFFYTGNYLVWNPHPKLMTLGVGKTASAHFVKIADEVWRERGMRYVLVSFLFAMLWFLILMEWQC